MSTHAHTCNCKTAHLIGLVTCLHCVGESRAGRGSEQVNQNTEEMSVCCLLVILLCFMSNGILLEEVIGESCTEGFMDYSLLEGKAANPTGSLRNNRLTENTATRWIIIENSMGNDITFTCDTVVTEILIGVDIRTVSDSVGRILYPKFEVWGPTTMNDVYTRVMSIEIRLTPDNFTTNGQYRFTLSTPLNSPVDTGLVCINLLMTEVLLDSII